MFTEEEKQQILSTKDSDYKLSIELRAKLLTALKNRETSIFEDGDYLCCDTGEPEASGLKYQWLTFDQCRAVAGRAADNSKCGH